MKVLLYEDPLTEKHDLTWRLSHVHLDAEVYVSLKASDVECRMIVNETGRETALANGVAAEDLIVIEEREITDALPNPQERVNHLLHERHCYDHRPRGPVREWAARQASRFTAEGIRRFPGEEVMRRLADFFRPRMAGFVPDAVTAWCPIPFFRRLFLTVRTLYKEAGFFGTAPFPWSHYLDPCGFHAHSWLRRHFNSARTCHEQAHTALTTLREEFTRGVAERSPLADQVKEIKSRFRKLLVVALQANNYYLFDKSCGYRSQAHVLLDVLRHAPEDCAVVVTQHPGHGLLTDPERQFISARYPNCVLLKEVERYHAPSQYLLAECDAVVTIGSAVGWFANFFGKPMVALGDCHLTPASAIRSLSQLPELLGEPERFPIDEGHLAWVMFHYSIPRSLYGREGFAAEVFRRFLGDEPFREPVIPYEEYVAEILATANWGIPMLK